MPPAPIRNVLAVSLIAFLSFTGAAAAEPVHITNESDLDALLPHQVGLEALLDQIQQEPDNLDNYYAYAKAAESLKQYKEATWAYRTMLLNNPKLDRVRLDLSLLYIAQGKFLEARQLLDEVLAHNPPLPVQNNIRTILAKMGNAGKPNIFSGSVSVGVNYDTNATAAPTSGNATVFDTSVPLSDAQKARSDLHNFVAITAAHSYQPEQQDEDVILRWKNSALSYLTRQASQKDLDIALYSLRSGPEITYRPLGIRVEVDGVYNYMELNHNSYLRDPRMDSVVEVTLSPQLSVQTGYSTEYQHFQNSPTVTTYTDRSGAAHQEQFGGRFALSPQSMWDLLGVLRHENAAMEFQANNQAGLSLSHTHLFDGGYFAIATLGAKHTKYAVPELLISSKLRKDNQESFQFSGGKTIEPYNFVVSGGYSYTNINSTIQNYTYDNHRFSLTFTKNF